MVFFKNYKANAYGFVSITMKFSICGGILINMQ